MRWKNVLVGLALTVAGVVGCQKQCFLHECDYDHYKMLGISTPPDLECNPTYTIEPAMPTSGAPATVLDPDRKIRYLTLAEAIARALENGTVGSQIQQQFGTFNDTLISFAGGAFQVPPDSIRVLALDPAITGANIEGALAKFDARWTSSMNWNVEDRPVGSALDVFQTAQNQGINAIQNTNAQFVSSLLKPLPTGGVAGITFRNDYQITNLPARVNPAYRPALQFQFEQPLLQNFGVEINQLRTVHPGSILTPFQQSGQYEGILITRLRFDQQRAEFERVLNYMLINVETAYWNLYGAYWNLYSREQALRQAYEAWNINRARYEAGRISIQDFAQTRQQYELFRAQRIAALGLVLTSERQLRGLLRLPMDDGTRLVPVDTPTLAPYIPDWATAVHECITNRPELFLVRQELKFRQLDLIRIKNTLLPDLRFTSTYDINGIGNRLDSADPNNAFRNLAENNFHNWALGLRLDMPIGFREAHTNLRIARLNLARTYGIVQEQELRAQEFLAQQYARVFEQYELIKAQRAQREAAAVQLDARFKQFLAGQGTLDILLEAQRVWADALRDEWNAVAQYNNALAGFEFAKGTIMRHDNVFIGEGGLPQCAQLRAVEHERERARALVLRERASPVVTPACCPENGCPGIPTMPADRAPSVPALLEGMPKMNWDAVSSNITSAPPGQPQNPATPVAPVRPRALPELKPTDTVPAPTSPELKQVSATSVQSLPAAKPTAPTRTALPSNAISAIPAPTPPRRSGSAHSIMAAPLPTPASRSREAAKPDGSTAP